MKLTLPVDSTGSPTTPSSLPPDSTETPPTAIDSHDLESSAAGRSELLLVCEARSTTLTDGFWRFALETAEGEAVLDAEDREMGDLNRLTLLAAVRGLEAIEGASSVTLLSNNRYLIRSLSDSLPRWRQNDFIWEHFGRRIDVQHADLWRRVDRALQIHRVEACLVSSRLVSSGAVAEKVRTSSRIDSHDQPDRSGSITRIDAGHPSGTHSGPHSSAVAAPGQRSTGGTNNDRLRSWLLNGWQSHRGAAPQRRFTSRDLVENA